MIRSFLQIAATVAVSTACILFSGCENDDNNTASDTNTPAGLAISPSSVSFVATASTNIVFTVSGGTTPYLWSVHSTTLGTIVDSDDTAIYTGYAVVGQNQIIVTDSSSNSVYATVDQY